MKQHKKNLIIYSIVGISYLVFSIVFFEFSYWHQTYFKSYESYFVSDLINYTLYSFLLLIILFILGLKLTWKTLLMIIITQLFVCVIFIVGLFLIFNGRNYDFNLEMVNHDNFYFWIDYRIGFNRWFNTRLTELGILFLLLLLFKTIPPHKRNIVDKLDKKGTGSLPLDDFD